MKARACLFAGVMVITPGPASGQTPMVQREEVEFVGALKVWGEIGGAGGTLEGIGRDDKPTVCGISHPGPTYPDLIHPIPTNPGGSPADCSRRSPDIVEDGPISVKDFMSGTARASADWFLSSFSSSPELEAVATVDTVQPRASIAEVDSGVSFYQENIPCDCLRGAQVSLTLDVSGEATSTSFGTSSVSVQVITASQVERRDDVFNIDTSNHLVSVSTTPLRIGASGSFAVVITLGAVQQGPGSTHGRVYPAEKPILVTGHKAFDPPASAGTTTRAITDFNNLAGWYTPSGGATQGFEVLPSGTIKAPIIDPKDNLHYTAPLGINNAGTIVGQYENASGGIDTFHGFLLSPKGAFTTYDIGIPGVSTGIQAINNNGDFAGDFGSSAKVSQGFLNSGGRTVTFGLPGLNTYPQAMNDSKAIVGVYLDKSGNYQSFQRAADGTLTTFNFPGAVSTYAEGINNAGTINGYFTDKAGKTHGFFGPLGLFLQYDLAGAAGTFASGINNAGAVTGSLADSSGVPHGFQAQLCAADVSSAVAVTRGAVAYDKALQEYVQTITLKNTGSTPIAGPLYVLFKNLSPGVFPANKGSGVSICMAPDTPLITVDLPTPTLLPGRTATVTVDFFDASKAAISYTTTVLAGKSPP